MTNMTRLVKRPPRLRTHYLKLFTVTTVIIWLIIPIELLLTETSPNSNFWFNFSLQDFLTMPFSSGKAQAISVPALVIIFFLFVLEFVVTTTQEFLQPQSTASLYDDVRSVIHYADFLIIGKWILSLAHSLFPCMDDLIQMGIRFVQTIILSFVLTSWWQHEQRTGWIGTQCHKINILFGDVKQALWSLPIGAKFIIGLILYLYAISHYISSRYHANMANPQHHDMCFTKYAHASVIQREFCLAQALWLPVPEESALIVPYDLSQDFEQPISVEYRVWPTEHDATPTNWVKHIQYPWHRMENGKKMEVVPPPPSTSVNWWDLENQHPTTR